MKRNRKSDLTSNPEPKLSPSRSRSPRHPLHETGTSSHGDVPKNGVRVLTFSTPVAGPPTLMVVQDDGRHTKEEQTLVGRIEAPFDRKAVLELYGVDLRFAIHNPSTGRWERCLFSCPLADMLEMLAAEGEFPFAFEAVPSQAEVDWAELKTRGQTERPMLSLKTYLTAATTESLAAVADDDRLRVRRGQPRGEAGVAIDTSSTTTRTVGELAVDCVEKQETDR